MSVVVAVISVVVAVTSFGAGAGVAVRAAEWMANKSWDGVCRTLGLVAEFSEALKDDAEKLADFGSRGAEWAQDKASDAIDMRTKVGGDFAAWMQSTMDEEATIIKSLLEAKNQTVDCVIDMMQSMFHAQSKLHKVMTT